MVSSASPAAMSRSEWTLLLLLVASIFINYIDRGNLSIAAPLIEKDLGLSPVQMGMLLSAFFWTYSLLQLLGFAGWLADVLPVGFVLSAGFLIWCFATFSTGLLSSFSAIYSARLLLGAGESVAYPCYSRAFATDFAQHHRGRANAFLDAGSKLGPAMGSLLGGILLLSAGWRLLFVILGLAGLLWLVPWFKHMPRSYARRRSVAGLPSMFGMLRIRSAWGTFLGHFCGNYFWFFLLTWLPTYLVHERNFSIQQMAVINSAALSVVAVGTLAAGFFSDRLIARGASPTRVRKGVVVSGLTCSSIILPVAFVQSAAISIVLLFLSCIAFGAYTSNHWAITQTLAGPGMAGRWTSLQNGIGNMSGIAAPMIAGFAVQTTGSSKTAFVVSAAVVVAGALMWGLVVGPVSEVNWNAPSQGVITV